MRAIDLSEQIPTVTTATTGAEAARVVAEYRLPGLVVVDAAGAPHAVIPGSQIVGLIVPRYVREDPGLAHAIDEASADDMCARLTMTTIGELLAAEAVVQTLLPSVAPDDTLLEVATAMVEKRSPLVVVRETGGAYQGVVMMSRLLAAIATLAGEESDLIHRRMTRDVIERGKPSTAGPDGVVVGGTLA